MTPEDPQQREREEERAREEDRLREDAAMTGEPAAPPPATEDPTPQAMRAADEATAQPAAAEMNAAAEPPPAQPPLPFEIPQPEPWRPSDDELDPTSDTGWERASEHELVAVRPEDIPAILAVQASGHLDPTVAREAIAGQASGRTTLPPVGARSGWASAGASAPGASAPGAGEGASAPGASAPGASAEAAASREGSTAASSDAFALGSGASGPFAGTAPVWPSAAAPNAAAVPPAANLIDFPQPAPEIALAPSERRWRRASRRVKGGLEAAARPVLLLALFGLGLSVGWAGYLGTRPLPAAAPVATLEPGTTTDVPPQVQSLIAAMNADDQSQLQLVVPSDPYRLLAGALAQEGVKSIRAAKALWTYTSGQDSATEILVSVTTQDGQNFTFNLVVHVHGGMITEFR